MKLLILQYSPFSTPNHKEKLGTNTHTAEITYHKQDITQLRHRIRKLKIKHDYKYSNYNGDASLMTCMRNNNDYWKVYSPKHTISGRTMTV
jgi:hypothetical protein